MLDEWSFRGWSLRVTEREWESGETHPSVFTSQGWDSITQMCLPVEC